MVVILGANIGNRREQSSFLARHIARHNKFLFFFAAGKAHKHQSRKQRGKHSFKNSHSFPPCVRFPFSSGYAADCCMRASGTAGHNRTFFIK